ncbi:membrane protein [Gordonia phage RayTheFireFly]|nr:membrane protein [Gordonia phage RayTheFireFly]
MFLELYSASVLTIMFVTAVVVWVRDERRLRRERRAHTVNTVTMVDPDQVVRFPHGDVRSAERRVRYLMHRPAVRR